MYGINWQQFPIYQLDPGGELIQIIQVQHSRYRSPLLRFATWIAGKATGTILEKPIYFFIQTTIGRLSASICLTILLGVILELTFHFRFPSTTFILIGAAAGGAAGGGGGAIVGGMWAWMLSKIIGLIVFRVFREPLATISIKFVPEWLIAAFAWIFAATLGWLMGRATAQIAIKISERHQKYRLIFSYLLAAVILSAASLVVYEMAIWSVFRAKNVFLSVKRNLSEHNQSIMNWVDSIISLVLLFFAYLLKALKAYAHCAILLAAIVGCGIIIGFKPIGFLILLLIGNLIFILWFVIQLKYRFKIYDLTKKSTTFRFIHLNVDERHYFSLIYTIILCVIYLHCMLSNNLILYERVACLATALPILYFWLLKKKVYERYVTTNKISKNRKYKKQN